MKPIYSNRESIKKFEKKHCIKYVQAIDPAAGSGNFLTETYISLRKIENEVLKLLYVDENKGIRLASNIDTDMNNIIRVSIGQFYGMEINDFAVVVSNTALWIAEYQMLKETEDILVMQIDYLPLKSYHHIIEGNALTIDWQETFKDANINYIMGNPPFVGGMLMTSEQKQEIENIFTNLKGVGEIDYVCAWYKKSCDFIKNTNIKVALVSTNSICQGQSVITFWKWLMENYSIEIDFAYKTFRWNSESNEKAKVHCVIIGFSNIDNTEKIKQKLLFENNRPLIATHINSYLINANETFIEVRSNPICDVPNMNFGNMPRDGGGFILTEDEKAEIDKNDKLASKYIHLYLGAEEFINNKKRYCLWLENANPNDIKKSTFLYERVNKVRDFRLSSKASSTRKMAETPTLFAQITQKIGESYILIPRVSSERRRYVPIGFLDGDTIAFDATQVITGGNLYHFGILTSNVHMAFMRAVSGRLKSDYRYSKDIVYNNFPWPIDISDDEKNLKDYEKKLIENGYPTIDKEQKNKIEETAKMILDARDNFNGSSLADLYDEMTMPDILRKAHRENDRQVLKSYGFKVSHTDFIEEMCVASLMSLYKQIIDTKDGV